MRNQEAKICSGSHSQLRQSLKRNIYTHASLKLRSYKTKNPPAAPRFWSVCVEKAEAFIDTCVSEGERTPCSAPGLTPSAEPSWCMHGSVWTAGWQGPPASPCTGLTRAPGALWPHVPAIESAPRSVRAFHETDPAPHTTDGATLSPAPQASCSSALGPEGLLPNSNTGSPTSVSLEQWHTKGSQAPTRSGEVKNKPEDEVVTRGGVAWLGGVRYHKRLPV